MKTQNYDESKIITLSSLEHIRLRSGMYIGRLGDGSNIDDGIYVLIKEIIDNSIDEFIMGYGNEIFIKKKIILFLLGIMEGEFLLEKLLRVFQLLILEPSIMMMFSNFL